LKCLHDSWTGAGAGVGEGVVVGPGVGVGAGAGAGAGPGAGAGAGKQLKRCSRLYRLIIFCLCVVSINILICVFYLNGTVSFKKAII